MCSTAGDIRPFPLEGPWLGLSIARRRSPADGLVSAAPFHQHVTPPDDAEFGQPIEARYPPPTPVGYHAWTWLNEKHPGSHQANAANVDPSQ